MLAKPQELATADPRAHRAALATDEPIRVALVDDHTLVREALRAVLDSEPDMAVVGEAKDGAQAVALAQRVKPRVLVLDLEAPWPDGAAVVSQLQQTMPDVRVLILTVYSEDERLLPLLEAGAHGCLTKFVAITELLDAIRVVAAGRVYVRPATARLMAERLSERRQPKTPWGRFQALSTREQSIVQLLAAGFTGVEVAVRLGISEKTVDAYKRRVQQKLGLVRRTDYVRFALDAGILA